MTSEIKHLKLHGELILNAGADPADRHFDVGVGI
jgi:hypothetical protein